MSYVFKVNDIVKTRDGREVTVVAVENPYNDKFQITALVSDSGMCPSVYTAEGRYLAGGVEHKSDLMPPPPKTRKVKLYAYLIQSFSYTHLQWVPELVTDEESWKRVPSEDKEVEVEE